MRISYHEKFGHEVDDGNISSWKKKRAKGWATGTSLLVIGTSYLSEADLSDLQEEALV